MIHLTASQINNIIVFSGLIKAYTILNNISSHAVNNQYISKNITKQKNQNCIKCDEGDQGDGFVPMHQRQQITSKLYGKSKSKFKGQQPSNTEQNNHKGNKNNKKQTIIKKKHNKFQKIPCKVSTHLIEGRKSNGSILLTPKNYDKHQYLSAKLLLNNQFLVKNSKNNWSTDQNIFPGSMNTDKDYRSLSSTPPHGHKKIKRWETPTKSKQNIQNNSINQYSSISSQLANSQQIQIVKHQNKFWPSPLKKKDVIDEMEKIKSSRTTSKNIDERYMEKAAQIEKKIHGQSSRRKLQEQQMNKLYLKSIGNKYIQKMVENYAVGKNKA